MTLQQQGKWPPERAARAASGRRQTSVCARASALLTRGEAFLHRKWMLLLVVQLKICLLCQEEDIRWTCR